MKTTALHKATLHISNFARQKLENLGKTINKLNKNNPLQQANLTGVDLSQLKFEPNQNFSRQKNAFDEQIPNLSKRLFKTSRFAKYGLLADKVTPENSFEKIVNSSLNQIAKISQKWAEFDLKHDERFHTQLSDSERHALAHAIANQNRTLATLGGISNVSGLVGILVDTLWLLTISLRSIFQIAQIYDKPLTGKQGIHIAFEILSKIDLKKLQEKQTLLAGLGILDNMASHNLQNLQNFNSFSDNDNVQNILKQLETLATQLNINLQNFNLSFLHKALPITAVAIGSAYNSMIIQEVLQVSLNTFAPTPKLANTDNDKAE